MAAAREPKFTEEDDISDDEEIYESLVDRMVALKVCTLLPWLTLAVESQILTWMDPLFQQEFIPESTRDAIAANAEAAHGVSVQALKWAGNAAWIVTTSMLILAVPVCF